MVEPGSNGGARVHDTFAESVVGVFSADGDVVVGGVNVVAEIGSVLTRGNGGHEARGVSGQFEEISGDWARIGGGFQRWRRSRAIRFLFVFAVGFEGSGVFIP